MALGEVSTPEDAKQLDFSHKAVGRYALDLPYHRDTVERLICGIELLFERIQSLESLEPTADSATIFNQLFDLVTVSKTTAHENAQILSDVRIVRIAPEIWRLWGAGEYCLERDFARKVVSGNSLVSCFDIYNTFPYLDQYRQLARMETNTIDTAIGELNLPPVQRIAFIGSGPTPFTSLCYQERYGFSVKMLNVDRNPEAIQLGSDVVQQCGFPSISFLQVDARHLPNMEEFDLVHFAAMVGDSPEEKTGLLIKVAALMRPGALILLRSTDALRRILYPPFQEDDRRVLDVVTPIVATKYFASATSLTAIVVQVDRPKGQTP